MAKFKASSEFLMRSLTLNGASQGEISQRMGLDPSFVSKAFKERLGISYTDLRDKGLIYHLDAVYKGNLFLFEVRTKFGLTPSTFHANIRTRGYEEVYKREKLVEGNDILRLKESLSNGGKPKVDVLVERGVPLGEMKREAGITRQAVEAYIRGSGQFRYWMGRRERNSLVEYALNSGPTVHPVVYAGPSSCLLA